MFRWALHSLLFAVIMKNGVRIKKSQLRHPSFKSFKINIRRTSQGAEMPSVENVGWNRQKETLRQVAVNRSEKAPLIKHPCIFRLAAELNAACQKASFCHVHRADFRPACYLQVDMSEHHTCRCSYIFHSYVKVHQRVSHH